MHFKSLCASLLFTLFMISTPAASLATRTYDGYTFVFSGKKVYLYDMDKTALNTWNCTYTIQACADLLRDSSILVSATSASDFENSEVSAGDLESGGIVLAFRRLQIINWKGDITWDYRFTDPGFTPHHDIEPVYRTNNSDEKPTILVVGATSWGDNIIEIRPTGKTTGEIIWEWVAKDHQCTANCTGKIGMLDEKFGGIQSLNKTSDLMHTNLVSYNRTLDQIILSVKGFNEMIIIDHSTTTEEASGITGGKSGKGGQILYRWGSPKNYGAPGTTQFKGQHHCCWVPDTLIGTTDTIPGRGNFLVIDNGNARAIELTCPGAKDGAYPYTTGQAFEPSSPLWQYNPEGLERNEGSIQKMPNGNYIIGTGGVDIGGSLGKTAFRGGTSKVYEVNSSGSIVWELDLDDEGIGISTEAYRYAYGYLQGAPTPVRRLSSDTNIPLIVRIRQTGTGTLLFITTKIQHNAQCSLYSLDGGKIVQGKMMGTENYWNPGAIRNGTYIARVTSGNVHITERITIQR